MGMSRVSKHTSSKLAEPAHKLILTSQTINHLKNKNDKSSHLRIITWNVWFSLYCREDRQRALINEALAHSPDVLGLQEVTPWFANSLRECKPLTDYYDISPQCVGTYGCIFLVRKDKFKSVDFSETVYATSTMGRTLLKAVS